MGEEFYKSESLSVEGLHEIIERYGWTPNNTRIHDEEDICGECRLKYLNDDRGPDITFQSNHTKISTILPSINYLWGTTTSVGKLALLSCETPEVR
jgi:hypothetical protein